MVESGQDANGKPIYMQDKDSNNVLLSDTFRSLEGLGMPINNSTGNLSSDTTRYYGIAFDGIEKLELRLAAYDDNFTFDVTPLSVTRTLAPVKTLVVAGNGNDYIRVNEIGGDTAILGGNGNDRVDVGYNNSLNRIGAKVTFDGDSDLVEQDKPVKASDYQSIIDNSPKTFINSGGQNLWYIDASGQPRTYANMQSGPIVFNDGTGNIGLQVLVLDSNGNPVEDMVQEKGVQKYGVQKTNTKGVRLYYDKDGNETTDASYGIPVIVATTLQENPAALPVYLNSKGEEIFQGSGLSAVYYNNMDFTGKSVSAVVPTVNFNWGTGSPDIAIEPYTFSARWTGQVQPRYSGTYTFDTYTDDGVRLWINGQLLIDNWGDHSPVHNAGAINLEAGKFYDVQMDFYQNGGGAVASLSWSSSQQVKEIIPSSRLYPTQPQKVLLTDSANGVPLYIDVNAHRVDDATLVVNKTGPDFNIYEEDNGLVEFSKLKVDVSQDGLTWHDVSDSAGAGIRIAGDAGCRDSAFIRSYDLASVGLSWAKYIRLTGKDSSSGGFDLDAIGIIHPGANAPVYPSILVNTTGSDLGAALGGPDSAVTYLPTNKKIIAMSNNRVLIYAACAPSLIPVQRMIATTWLRGQDVYVTGSGGNDVLLVNDAGDTGNAIGTMDNYWVASNSLDASGKVQYHSGSIVLEAKTYLGGEPVADPFTGSALSYKGGELVYDLFSKQQLFDIDGRPLLHAKGEPMLHYAGEPVIHGAGEVKRYLGGEKVYDESGAQVFNSDGSAFLYAGGQVTIHNRRDPLLNVIDSKGNAIELGTPYVPPTFMNVIGNRQCGPRPSDACRIRV